MYASGPYRAGLRAPAKPGCITRRSTLSGPIAARIQVLALAAPQLVFR